MDGAGRRRDGDETIIKSSGSTANHGYTYVYDMRSQLTDANITNIGGTWAADYAYHKSGNISMESQCRKRTGRLAVASLISVIGAVLLGLVFCFFTLVGAHGVGGVCVVGVVILLVLAPLLGLAGIAVISVRRKTLKGYVYAVLSIVLASPAIYVMYGIDSAGRLREERRRTNTGHYNLQVLGEAMAAYAKAHDGYLPVAETWCDLLMEHNGELSRDNFRHPLHWHDNLRITGDCHFGYNKNLSGRRLSDLADDVVLLVEADGPWNLNGAVELLETRRSEHGFIYVLLADGRVEPYVYKYDAIRKFTSDRDMSYQKLRWKPWGGDMSSRTIESIGETFDYTGHQMTDADGNNLSYDENGNLTAGVDVNRL